MKNLFTFLTMVCVLMSSGWVFAASGSAHIMPTTWSNGSSSFEQPNILISNITDESVDVVFTLYDETGVIQADGDDSQTSGLFTLYGASVTNYDDNPTGASVSFTLAANDTVRLRIVGSSTLEHGYGLIEYSHDGAEVKALVAMLKLREGATGHDGISIVPVNQGLPF